MSTPAERAAEFNTLVTEQAIIVRARRGGYPEPDVPRCIEANRMARLYDLAEVINADPDTSVRYDVEEAIDRWIDRNPLALNNVDISRVMDKVPGDRRVGLEVIVGDRDKGSQHYVAVQSDLTYGNRLILTIPDSIAEAFRQQGRRQVQREMCAVIGAAYHS